jgi:protein-S-isoprenylcysteine O-methyltransferase Ste14
LYAAFLLFICPAWAIFQDHWLYLAWAGLLHPLWHWNIRGEEKLMRDAFGEDYDRYCAVTGRFVPRIF